MKNRTTIYPGKKDLLMIGVLAFFCLFIFRGVIINGHLLYGSDFVAFYQGMKQFLYNEFHNHNSIPFWNPYIFSGMPFWAHFESTIFYPLDILFWLMAPATAFGYTMFFHMLLAALFMYLLMRSLNTGAAGSFVAAAIFTCNGLIMATLYDGQMFRVQAYVWLPLVIYFLNRAIKPGNPFFHLALAGLFWGIQILSGSPQDALYTLMAASLFCVCLTSYEGLKIKRILRPISILLLFFVVGTGIAAIQLVPAFGFINLSVRSAFDAYNLVTLGSYPPEGIITTFIPDFFGKYANNDFWVSNTPWSIPLYNLYVGILPLFLMCFISFKPFDNRKITLFAGILALISFFLALGANTPLYRLIYLLPGFDRIRAPAKIIYLWVFAFSLLAGKGMDGLFGLPKSSVLKRITIFFIPVLLLVSMDILFHRDQSLILRLFSPFVLDEAIPEKLAYAIKIIGSGFHIFTLLSAAILLIILLFLKGLLSTRVAAALLGLLLLFDLGYLNRGAIRYGDKVYGNVETIKNGLNQSLARDQSIFRVGSLPHNMSPNLEMYLGYQTVAGYNPLYLHRYYEYIRAYNKNLLGPGAVLFYYVPHGKSVFMDLLNVKYELSHSDRRYSLRNSYLPRTFIVSEHEIVPKDEILSRMADPGFDPLKRVLLEKEDAHPLPHNPDLPAKNGRENETEILSYRADEIEISLHAKNPGYLFLSEVYYPGWKAFVDGRPETILRGNYLFRTVKIPQGNHRVRLVFDPFSIKIGIAATALMLLIVLASVIFRFMGPRLLHGNKTPKRE